MPDEAHDRPPAVDHQRRPVGHLRVVARQIVHGGSDVPDGREAPTWDLGEHGVPEVRCVQAFGGTGGVGGSRRDAGHDDPVRRPLEGETLGHLVEASLGRGVDDLILVRDHRQCGTHVDDPAVPAGKHVPRRCLSAEECHPQVEVNHRVPVTLGHVDGGDWVSHPRVVHEDVGASEIDHDLVEQRGDLRNVPQIRRVRARGASVLLQISPKSSRARGGAAHGIDEGAVVDEVVHEPATDSAGRPGDDHHLATDVELVHAAASLRSGRNEDRRLHHERRDSASGASSPGCSLGAAGGRARHLPAVRRRLAHGAETASDAASSRSARACCGKDLLTTQSPREEGSTSRRALVVAAHEVGDGAAAGAGMWDGSPAAGCEALTHTS